MANTKLFQSASSQGKQVPESNTFNSAGGKAYALTDKAALAQTVITGCFGNTYYTTADVQLEKLLELCANVPNKFIAQAAVYARTQGFMKDTPALLCAVLAVRDVAMLKNIFNRVIDNGRLLRGFVTIMRSGKAGRNSFGTAVKRLVQNWFNKRTDEQLFRDSVGEEGASLADCIKLCHPAPKNKEREALYAYIIGKKVVEHKTDMEKNEKVAGRFNTVLLSVLPQCVQDYENYKKLVLSGKDGGKVPNVEFRLLTALNLGTSEWTKIAKDANYQMARMNLNTFARHGVFNDTRMVDVVAQKLTDVDALRKARVFPYQLFTAYKNVSADIPSKIVNALQDAAELAIENVPSLDGKVYIFVDCSGSMHSAVTGNRGTATSKVSCLDVAALFAASILRKNQDAEVIAFNTSVVPCHLNSRDSIMTNAQKLAALPQGGTACGVPLRMLNEKKASGDLCIMISDNESWADMARGDRGTSAAQEWSIFKKRNPQARFVALDLTPNTNVQVQDDKAVLNVGGFSDNVFSIISAFARNEMNGEHFVDVIEKVEIVSEEAHSIVHAAKAGAKKAVGKKKVAKKTSK